MFEETRSIPTHVRRQLRQESHFGCVVCGEPVLDYHHIIPWSEKKHNDPEHMVAVCPTHHRIIGKMARSEQYRRKNNPTNKHSGQTNGFLATDKEQPSFKMGSNTFINTPVILSYFGQPIIKYIVRDGQSLLSAYLPKSDFWPEVKIIENDVSVWSGDLWDFEFRTNFMKIVRKDRSRFFEIDLRAEHAAVRGNLLIGQHEFIFSESESNIGSGMRIQNCTFSNCGGGIAFGNPRQRLLYPNFAMSTPRAQLILV